MIQAQESVLEVNLKALLHNYDFIKSKVDDKTKILAVVKAYGYGSDAIEIAKYLEEQRNVDYLAVAYIREGAFLRAAGITTPILVLHPQIVNLKHAIAYNLEPSLYNDKILNAFIKIAAQQGTKEYPVHIKFNTGLNRLGFFDSDVGYVANKLKNLSHIKITSLFSHLAASEDINERDFSLQQIRTFNTIVENFEKITGKVPIKHMANTSGILNYPEAHFNMVRSGIGLYGFANDKTQNTKLKPIAALKSIISQIHRIEKGESVGYNRAYIARDAAKIATIPLGHADGIGRHYGNGVGKIVINGKKATIIGNVCMDMIMVDVTNIDCNEGDAVTVFGEEQTAEEFATTANTISYELITAVSQRIKRVFLR